MLRRSYERDPPLKKIAVPEDGLETLFGAYDENLNQLEALFGVRIRTQGHELIVDGAPPTRRASSGPSRS